MAQTLRKRGGAQGRVRERCFILVLGLYTLLIGNGRRA